MEKKPVSNDSTDRQNQRRPARLGSLDRESMNNKAQPPPKKNEAKKRRPPSRKKRKRKIKEPKSPKNRKRRIFIWYFLTIFVLLTIFCVLSVTLFFKIDNIVVDGETRYDDQDIIEYCGIEEGENLILCDTKSGVEVIETQFPYIESVSIERRLFSTVVIYVEEAEPVSALESDGSYIILSKSGKILEITDELEYDVPLVKGANVKSAKLAETVEYEDESLQEVIEEVIDAIEDYGLSDYVRKIDISNPANIEFTYDDRITVVIGTPEDIDYKLKTAILIIEENLDEDAEGTLDVSLCASDGGQSYFNPS